MIQSVKYTSAILLPLIVAMSSCADQKDAKTEDLNALLVNTWKLTEFTPSPKFPMSDSIRQQIIATTMIEYTADKKFRQTGIGRVHTGTWSISDDGQRILYIHAEKNASFVEIIQEFKHNKLSVIDQNGNKMTRTPVSR
jgi:hypothetical protein